MKLRNLKFVSILPVVLTAILLSFDLKATAQQYPTEAEITAKFNKFIKRAESITEAKYYRDFRTPAAKKALESFVKFWSKSNPESAPFLGTWATDEGSLGIYPTEIRNRVCIVQSELSRDARFSLGKISGGSIYTDNNTILVQRGRYLGRLYNDTERKIVYDTYYHSPRLLRQPEEVLYVRKQSPKVSSELHQKYRDAGCRASLP